MICATTVNSIHRRSDCRICHGSNLELILPLTPTPIGDQYLDVPKPQPLYDFNLYQCRSCGFVHMLDEIPEFHHAHVFLTGSVTSAASHFESFARSLIDFCGLQKGDMVIDIGSNDGSILQTFKALGMEVTGFEPNAKLTQIARERGITTISEYFGKGHDVRQAKLITANNVVANINDLDAFMDGIVEVLAPGGTFVFESFYLRDILQNRVFDFVYHEQPSAFSVRPVKALMRRYGLRLFHAEYTQGRGGLMRFYCGAGRPEVPDDDQLLYDPQTYAVMAKSISEQREKTRSFLGELASAGKTMCGFGATVSATGIIYHFGLADFIRFLVDDNPAKVGRFSPGLHLPVLRTEKSREVDYTIVLPWLFEKAFKQVHPNNKLIIPLPYFNVA